MCEVQKDCFAHQRYIAGAKELGIDYEQNGELLPISKLSKLVDSKKSEEKKEEDLDF